MRLWSIHPQYLDPKGLIALWRESLLAKAVLSNATKGYTKHPQLQRFKEQRYPLAAINAYLWAVYDESCARGYRFDPSKLEARTEVPEITVTRGQLDFETKHLLLKLRERSPKWADTIAVYPRLGPHPLFVEISGPIEKWER